MDQYEVMAKVLVVAIPAAAIGLAATTVAWARDSISRSPLTGLIGVVCTLIAAGNLFVERSCDRSVNRPVIAVALGTGDCYRSGLIAVQVVLLLAVATSVVVRLGDMRQTRQIRQA